MERIKIAIIEDQPIMRLGIKTAIQQEDDLEVCGDASCGKDGLELVRLTNPDVVLLDIGLPDISGLKVAEQIKQITTSKIIILTGSSGQDVVQSAFQLGADSYLLKKANLESLKRAIYTTYSDQGYIDEELIKRLIERHRQKGNLQGKLPTDTELLILKLVAKGLSNKAIANELCVTYSTVKSHVANLFLKFGADDRVHLIIQAQRLGYLEFPIEDSNLDEYSSSPVEPSGVSHRRLVGKLVF